MGLKNAEKYTSPLEKEPPSFVSRLFYCWMFPLFYNGTKRDLEEPDLARAKHMYDSKTVGDVLERKWIKELLDSRAAGRKPSITLVLFKCFASQYIIGGILQFTFVCLRTVTPLLFAQLLTYWSVEAPITREVAAMYAGGMILGNWLAAFANHHGNLYCQQFGMKLRIATSSLMFRKVMRMDNGSLGETTAGKLVNLLSNDLQRFDMAFTFIHYVWIIPVQIAVVAYLGYMQAGYAAIIGLAALILISLPLITLLGKMIQTVRSQSAQKTDDRIKIMNEVINGIQVIKMYAWEVPFQQMVSDKRTEELKSIKSASIYRTIFMGFLLFTERTALLLTILSLLLFGDSFSAGIIFPIEQFLMSAQFNITLVLPIVVAFTAELYVSLGRVQEFLTLDDRSDLKMEMESPPQSELNHNSSNNNGVNNKEYVKTDSFQYNSELQYNGHIPVIRKLSHDDVHHHEFAVEIHELSASWTNDPDFLALRNVTMRIPRGKLCAIIGTVGSGKSSILQALLKELSPMSGTVSVNGKISYASQEAWLFPATVRENILFGLPYDSAKYKTVTQVCALQKDFKQFPFGDQTLVGERGVSLSGGQRARINLARAVYRESDIYLLDDPLSAVDANVGRLLFEGCINGYLQGKTRVLVTHQVHFLKAAEYIILLNEGHVQSMGTYDELSSSGFSMFSSSQEDKKKEDNEFMTKSQSQKSSAAIESKEDMPEFEAQKMVIEEMQSGNIKWEVISSYFRAGGNGCFITFTVLLVTLSTFIAAGTDYWISFWTNQIAEHEKAADGAPIDISLDTQVGPFSTAQYLWIQGILVLSCILITNIRVIPFVHLCINASKNLHDKMFSVMIRGIMRFFDTSSSGRILNRFTKDMGAVDDVLPRTLLDVTQIYSSLVAIFILNALALYWTLIPSFILLILFGILISIYIKTAQGVKRLEGVTKSPVFGMVTSSLSGIATIRSSGAQLRLIDDFDKHQDLHTSAWNCFLAGGSTFGFYLDTVCFFYLLTVVFIFLYLDFGSLVSVGSVGLAVTQSNSLTAMLQHGARTLVECVAQLTSVERVLEYTRIPTEDNLFEGQVPAISSSWPSHGKIVFKDVYLRYAPDQEPVLKNLNLVIESGWKVGIVGRTGAGKSSLIAALFRFAYIDGSISIDGVDTLVVARQELRSKISIIPQEPVLFSATIRYNLDPFNVFSDEDLWQALEQVDMKSAVPSLDFKVTEGGANFSVGQRQLMCLARAVLRSNKVLIMDEATANVDPQTDNFIQRTVRRQFAACTVLTIAHRLNTIMDSDHVLVMSAGQVAEFDHPYHLLSNPDSHFSFMVRETGDKNSSTLYQMAKDSYFKQNVKSGG